MRICRYAGIGFMVLLMPLAIGYRIRYRVFGSLVSFTPYATRQTGVGTLFG